MAELLKRIIFHLAVFALICLLAYGCGEWGYYICPDGVTKQWSGEGVGL